jgi:hypothetical protein
MYENTSDSTATAQGANQNVVGPYGVSYQVRQNWILDATTLKPIGVNDEYTFS